MLKQFGWQLVAAGGSEWQLNHTLSFLDGDVVSVQEVAVETSLQAARQNLSQAISAINLVSVHPVQDVEESVHAQGGHIVRSDVLNDPNLVKHDDLRNECQGLKPQTQTPLQLEPPFEVCEWRVVLRLIRGIANQREHKSGRNQCLEVGEVVAEGVIGLQKQMEWSAGCQNK